MKSSEFYNEQWINIDGNYIHRTAIIHDCVKLGKGNTIGAYSVIGGNGEIRGVKQGDFEGIVEIGNDNVISELVTIQRPFAKTKTIIGNNNLIMAHSHIGHDASIGNNTEICSGVIVGGYAVIKTGAKIKLGSTIRNRKIVGENSLVGLGSAVVTDVKDESVVMGNPAKQKHIESYIVKMFRDLFDDIPELFDYAEKCKAHGIRPIDLDKIINIVSIKHKFSGYKFVTAFSAGNGNSTLCFLFKK